MQDPQSLFLTLRNTHEKKDPLRIGISGHNELVKLEASEMIEYFYMPISYVAVERKQL